MKMAPRKRKSYENKSNNHIKRLKTTVKTNMQQKLRDRRSTISVDDSIFTGFHADKTLLKELKHSVDIVRLGKDELGFNLLKLEESNARISTSFTNATCSTRICSYVNVANRLEERSYSLGNIFAYGLDALREYINNPRNIPCRKGARIALSNLLKYWSSPNDDREALAVDRDFTGKECEWALILAQHLFSKLTVKRDYKIDSKYSHKGDESHCPCPSHDTLTGSFGDTSIGLKTGWHGNYDLLLHNGVPVAVESGQEGPTSESDLSKSDSAASSNTSDLDSPDSDSSNSSSILLSSDQPSQGAFEANFNSSQLISQCIVFSFLKYKNNPNLETALVPVIGISTDVFTLYFYDCVNDVFLQVPCVTYLFSGKLSKTSLLALWLTVNYKYFCSGLPQPILDLNFKADFFKRVDDRLESYKTEIESPCHVSICQSKNQRKRVKKSPEVIAFRKIKNINKITRRELYNKEEPW